MLLRNNIESLEEIMNNAHGTLNIGPFSFRRPKHAPKWKRVAFGLELLLGALAIAIVCSVSPQGAETGSAEAQVSEYAQEHEAIEASEMVDVPDQVTTREECAHAWVPVTRTIDHPETSHQAVHDAIYKTTPTLHTVCNECHKAIDGRAQAHLEKTGHVGFTTSVPIDEKVLVKEAWTETVIDEAAWTETVIDGHVCSICDAKTGTLA